MPIAEYFVLPSGKIPRFKATELYPLQTTQNKLYDGVHILSGAIVKLYDYQVGSSWLFALRIFAPD